jgi:wyosine [tRNA(Phe)-imidazoG37] synthetase (radical SAM superfamily)
MWLEILFVSGMNDYDDEVYKMKQVIDELQPERVHLNTVVRPPAYSFAKPTSPERLREIQKILGNRSEIVGIFKETHKTQEHNVDGQAILALLERRAMTLDQMIVSMAMKKEEVIVSLDQLLQGKFIKSYIYDGKEFYQAL